MSNFQPELIVGFSREDIYTDDANVKHLPLEVLPKSYGVSMYEIQSILKTLSFGIIPNELNIDRVKQYSGIANKIDNIAFMAAMGLITEKLCTELYSPLLCYYSRYSPQAFISMLYMAQLGFGVEPQNISIAEAFQMMQRLQKSKTDKKKKVKNLRIKKSEESKVRDLLKSQIGGKVEVTTPSGRIDLLTSSELIEIKTASEWKNGIGQLMAYQIFYPKHQKRLHLFFQDNISNLETIKYICSELDILLTTQNI